MDEVQIRELIKQELKKLRIDVRSGSFTDPNSRRVSLRLGDEEIASTYFDVKQQDEYEG